MSEPEALFPFRRLALAVFSQAAADLNDPRFRAGAAAFLTEDLWDTWGLWIGSLRREPVEALVRRPPERAGLASRRGVLHRHYLGRRARRHAG